MITGQSFLLLLQLPLPRLNLASRLRTCSMQAVWGIARPASGSFTVFSEQSTDAWPSVLKEPILVWNGKVVTILFSACAVLTFFAAICPGALFAQALNGNDKLLHALVFALLTVLARIAFPRFNPAALVVCLALFGGLIELAQTVPVFRRQASPLDWLADCLAIIAAMLILRAFASLRRGISRAE